MNFCSRSLFCWTTSIETYFCRPNRAHGIHSYSLQYLHNLRSTVESSSLSINFDFLHASDVAQQVYPIWLCPHRLFKLPVKTTVYLELDFELHRRQGDTHYVQMYTDIGVYYSPGTVLRGEVVDGAEAVRRMESWLIKNHGFQPQYAVSELNEKAFWRMFDAELYEQTRKKYGAVGTFMSVYYKSKKGRKTEKEVQEAERAHLETAYAEADQPTE